MSFHIKMSDVNRNFVTDNDEISETPKCSICSLDRLERSLLFSNKINDPSKPCKLNNLINAGFELISKSETFKSLIKKSENDVTPKDNETFWTPILINDLNSIDGCQVNNYPYKSELQKLEPSQNFFSVESLLFQEIKSENMVYIKTSRKFKKMMLDLKDKTEIAVHLNHYKKNHGFTWLLQISTQYTDYVINACELRSELGALNKIFADPSILKIFYNSETKIEYLMRDFALYIVNMFDLNIARNFIKSRYSHIAKKIFPVRGILYFYLNIHTNCYFFFKNNFINILLNTNDSKNAIKEVYNLSISKCVNVYRHVGWAKSTFVKILKQENVHKLSEEQKCALKNLSMWRYEVAKNNDLLLHRVLPDKVMIQIVIDYPLKKQIKQYLEKKNISQEFRYDIAKILNQANRLLTNSSQSKPIKKFSKKNKVCCSTDAKIIFKNKKNSELLKIKNMSVDENGPLGIDVKYPKSGPSTDFFDLEY